mmetsp:Transcript_14903/g.39938  ORF Transcript_14903/g.39938 Transcript_14903/m.39938 type:complete len:217 (-) Transcript_14903:553-1203(-)
MTPSHAHSRQTDVPRWQRPAVHCPEFPCFASDVCLRSSPPSHLHAERRAPSLAASPWPSTTRREALWLGELTVCLDSAAQSHPHEGFAKQDRHCAGRFASGACCPKCLFFSFFWSKTARSSWIRESDRCGRARRCLHGTRNSSSDAARPVARPDRCHSSYLFASRTLEVPRRLGWRAGFPLRAWNSLETCWRSKTAASCSKRYPRCRSLRSVETRK